MEKYLDGLQDTTLKNDLIEIAENEILKDLKESTIFITGSTGLIGSLIIKSLLCSNYLNGTNIKVIGLARNKDKAKNIFKGLLQLPNLEIVYGDILSNINLQSNIDYIIHAASQTTSKLFITHPTETIDITVKGTKNVLELAKQNKIKKYVYISSMEVYGVTDPTIDYVTENIMGYINPLDTRSSYSLGKRMAECLSISYGEQYSIPVTIARLSQTFGAGVLNSDNRVYAQFANSSINGSDIVLHTDGTSTGNYCYTTDTIIGIFNLLVKGVNNEAYNISNMKNCSIIKDMAELVANDISNNKINVVFDIPESNKTFGYAPSVKMKLDSTKLMNLGWEPKVSLLDSYKKLINSKKTEV